MRLVLRIFGWVVLVLVVTAAFGAAGYAFSALQEEQYEATTRLAFGRLLSPELQLLGPDFGEPDIEEEVRIQTEAALVDSFDVAVATAEALVQPDFTPEEVNERIEVLPERGSLVVGVTATAATPQLAVELAETYAQEYIALRREEERERAKAVQDALERRLGQLPPRERVGLRGAQLRDQISNVATLGRLGSGSAQIIEEARASSTAVQPQTQRNVLFGLLFGLVAGIGLVAGYYQLRRRLRGSSARRDPQTLDGSEPRTREYA